MTTQIEKETVYILCCPVCKSDNIRVRIDTDGARDCVECNDCKFSDYYKGTNRKYPDEQQWKKMFYYNFIFYVTYHQKWEAEKIKAENDEHARKIAKANLGYDCYGYQRHSKVQVFINGVFEEYPSPVSNENSVDGAK